RGGAAGPGPGSERGAGGGRDPRAVPRPRAGEPGTGAHDHRAGEGRGWSPRDQRGQALVRAAGVGALHAAWGDAPPRRVRDRARGQARDRDREEQLGRQARRCLLLAKNCTVTLAHSRTEELPARCREADIVIAAVGKAKLVGPDWIRPGATVIDVGMNRDEAGRLCGDVDFAAVEPIAGAITPVPGGVGPMTIAMLLDNTLQAARARVASGAGES